jgi:hypothetical protein
VESIRLEQGGRGYRASGNLLGVWSPAPTLLVAHVVGHGLGDFATPLNEEFDRAATGGARVHVFIDLERMPGYDSPLRIRCTEHFRARLDSFASFHIFVPSRVVAMGVAVANVALRGIVTVHATRPPFTRALDNQLGLHRVSGFSSNVLAT